MRDKMSADELRAVEEGTHLVVKLHEDEYWMQGEGKVTYVKETRDGHTVGMTPLSGPQHTQRLKIPEDARSGLTFTGAAKGANNLRVNKVYSRD